MQRPPLDWRDEAVHVVVLKSQVLAGIYMGLTAYVSPPSIMLLGFPIAPGSVPDVPCAPKEGALGK